MKKKTPVLILLLFFAVQGIAQTKIIAPPTTVKLAPESRDSLVTFIPTTIGPYCPKQLLGGDREFSGNGPEIWASIELKIIDGKHIDAYVMLHARETKSDWSETKGSWVKRLYSVPNNYTTIAALESGKFSEVHFTSRPGPSVFSPVGITDLGRGSRGEEPTAKDDGLVSRWNIVGDTSGGDISEDDNPHDDTSVTVQLNPMKIKLKITQNKPVNTLKGETKLQSQSQRF